MFAQFTRIMRWCLLLLLCIPVLAGLVGVIFPALGYFPAIGANSFSLDVFRTLFALDDIWHMVWLSLFTGVGSTLLAMAGAFLLLATFYQSSWLEKVQGLLSPFLVFPHAAAAIALLFVLSPSGIFARLMVLGGDDAPPAAGSSFFPYDEFGFSVLLALSLKELPFIILMALSVMSQPLIKKKLLGYVNVGASLGYSPTASFFKLVAPSIFTQIKLPILAVLVFATSNVEIPLILGSNNRVP